MASSVWEPTVASPRMFWEFCAKRMEEWHNRQTRPKPPYSDDPVLDKQIDKIPNVFRELDRETRYLNDHIRGWDPVDALFGSIAFRLTSQIPLFEKFGGIPKFSQANDWMEHIRWAKANGVPIFVRIYYTPHTMSYLEAMTDVRDFLPPIAERYVNAPNLKVAHKELSVLPQVKTFFAWQCTADMLEAGVRKDHENSWTYLGPGPIQAFNVIYGRRFTQAQAMVLARRYLAIQDQALANTIVPWKPPPHIPRFTLKNIEHALCEYFRWVKAHWNWRIPPQ